MHNYDPMAMHGTSDTKFFGQPEGLQYLSISFSISNTCLSEYFSITSTSVPCALCCPGWPALAQRPIQCPASTHARRACPTIQPTRDAFNPFIQLQSYKYHQNLLIARVKLFCIGRDSSSRACPTRWYLDERVSCMLQV